MTRTILSVVALAAIAPAAVSAQTTVVSDEAVRIERAEILTEQAWLLASHKGDFENAAIQLREAAALRGTDFQSVADLVNAGRFQFYANRKITAVSTLRVAAETAEQIGDLATAARTWREAAWVAAEAGELSTAVALLERADATLADVAVVALGTFTVDR